MDPRGGNRRSRAPSRSTGFRFAPTGTRKHVGRPAGRSVSRTRKAENAQFRAGSRQGDSATRRSLTSARCGPNWLPSPTPRLTTGRYLEKLRPNERAVDFFHAQRGFRPSRATGSIAPSCAATSAARSAIRYLRDKATTEPEVLRRELGFFRKHGRRLRKPQGQRLHAPVLEAANKVLVNQRMKRARWSMRSKCPHHRWSDRLAWRLEPRTKRRMPLDGENQAVKTGSLAKIDPYPSTALDLLRIESFRAAKPPGLIEASEAKLTSRRIGRPNGRPLSFRIAAKAGFRPCQRLFAVRRATPL